MTILSSIIFIIFSLFAFLSHFKQELFFCGKLFTSHFLCSGNTFLTVTFMNFDIFSLHFDFNPIATSNNSLERLSVSNILFDFIVDSLCAYILDL